MGSPGRRDWALQDTALVIGAASRDLTADDPRGWRLGGAVTYAGLTLARLGISTRVLVGIDAIAATAAELDLLRAAGADVEPVGLVHGPVFENIETPSGRRQHCLSVADPMTPSALPAHWREATNLAAVVFGPVAGELGNSWTVVPPDGALVALGWHGLLRTLVAGREGARRPPVAEPLLERADLVAVSEHDLGPLVRASDAVALVRPGATVVITPGDRGGSAFPRPAVCRSPLRAHPPIPPRPATAA